MYVDNYIKTALGIEGNTDPTQAEREAAVAATGYTGYVSMEFDAQKASPEPEPEPEPETTIGSLTVTGDDLTGTSVRFAVGAETSLTAAFDGDADDVRFKWSIRTGTSATIKSGRETATVTLTGVEAGDSGLLCTLSSDTASDSPQDKVFVVGVTE